MTNIIALVACFMLCFLTASFGVEGATQSSTFVANPNNFMNSERGVYIMNTYTASSWESQLTPSYVENYKSKYNCTIYLFDIILDSFVNTATIPQSFLTLISTEFTLYRQLGLKAIIRFAYGSDSATTDPDVKSAAICFQHMATLMPVLQANADVIMHIQAGFVGEWGEWYYTTAFSTGAPDYTTTAQNKADRKTIVDTWTAAFPDKTVELRTPYWMQTLFSSTPLSAPAPATEFGRIGFHDDCFLADSEDSGTYQATGDKPYVEAQTKYTGSTFETCGVDSVTDRTDCSNAVPEIFATHMATGHREFDLDVWKVWESQGCYQSILTNLGYRLTLVSSSFSLSTSIADVISANIVFTNSGSAAPKNNKQTHIVLRRVDNGDDICVASLPTDARTWYSGTSTAANTITLSATIRLPSNMNAGRWEVLLQVVDTYTSIQSMPWYKTIFANNGIVEGTGFHKMNAIVDVLSTAATTPVSSNEVTAACGYRLSNLVSTTVSPPADNNCLAGYYYTSSACMMCPVGYACATASASPKMCTSGTYATGAATACTPCPTCRNGGVCQVNTGACLCPSGFSAYDCSVSSSSTPPTGAPTTSPNGGGLPTAAPAVGSPAYVDTVFKSSKVLSTLWQQQLLTNILTAINVNDTTAITIFDVWNSTVASQSSGFEVMASATASPTVMSYHVVVQVTYSSKNIQTPVTIANNVVKYLATLSTTDSTYVSATEMASPPSAAASGGSATMKSAATANQPVAWAILAVLAVLMALC